jgi:hypothetical protein
MRNDILKPMGATSPVQMNGSRFLQATPVTTPRSTAPSALQLLLLCQLRCCC